MTPAARLSAAIAVLDRILAGAPVEQTLTNWGRGNRFAGAGDRHAIRDLVFEALRCKCAEIMADDIYFRAIHLHRSSPQD